MKHISDVAQTAGSKDLSLSIPASQFFLKLRVAGKKFG